MNYFFAFVSVLLFTTIVAENKNETIESIQNLILEKINETSASDFQPCDENLMKNAKFGDLIEIKRNGYFHWCTYIRNGTVIQLDNPEFDQLNAGNVFKNFTGNIELRSLIELAGNDSCRINNKANESKRKGWKVLPDKEILKMMKDELKQNVTHYNVITYNCEHFAAKLRFGISHSSQIEALKQILKNIKGKLADVVSRMFKVAANMVNNSNHTLTDGAFNISSVTV